MFPTAFLSSGWCLHAVGVLYMVGVEGMSDAPGGILGVLLSVLICVWLVIGEGGL